MAERSTVPTDHGAIKSYGIIVKVVRAGSDSIPTSPTADTDTLQKSTIEVVNRSPTNIVIGPREILFEGETIESLSH